MRRRNPGEDFSHRPNPKLARRKPPRPRDIKSGGGNYGKWKCALAPRSILAHYRTNKSDTFILSFHQSDFSGLSVDQVGNAAAADSNSFWDRRHFHDPPVAQRMNIPASSETTIFHCWLLVCWNLEQFQSSNSIKPFSHASNAASTLKRQNKERVGRARLSSLIPPLTASVQMLLESTVQSLVKQLQIQWKENSLAVFHCWHIVTCMPLTWGSKYYIITLLLPKGWLHHLPKDLNNKVSGGSTNCHWHCFQMILRKL